MCNNIKGRAAQVDANDYADHMRARCSSDSELDCTCILFARPQPVMHVLGIRMRMPESENEGLLRSRLHGRLGGAATFESTRWFDPCSPAAAVASGVIGICACVSFFRSRHQKTAVALVILQGRLEISPHLHLWRTARASRGCAL